MKIRLTVEFEVENDWDNGICSILGDGGAGRKQIVGSFLRRATMSSVMEQTAPLLHRNSIMVHGVQVSEPEFVGWDNARIAAELEATS